MSSFIKSMPSDEKIKALASNDLKDANENNIDDIDSRNINTLPNNVSSIIPFLAS